MLGAKGTNRGTTLTGKTLPGCAEKERGPGGRDPEECIRNLRCRRLRKIQATPGGASRPLWSSQASLCSTGGESMEVRIAGGKNEKKEEPSLGKPAMDSIKTFCELGKERGAERFSLTGIIEITEEKNWAISSTITTSSTHTSSKDTPY